MRNKLAIATAGVLVVALATAPAGLAGFKSGTYTGNSDQPDNNGLMLTVNKKKTKVNLVFFEWSAKQIAPCGGGPGGAQWAGLTAKIKPTGKFKVLSPADGFYGYVKGKFNGRKAEGTAYYHYDELGCDSGIVDWTAHKSS
jgi:hypothetical protein